ncbi:MAG: hypothetical protein IT258_07120 [Saprospiraceae bacterium]|nr:hypothetical protein [Saprospiraceae bacterium]
MKQLLRHITVYLLTVSVFVATTGLSIHHLYCYCKGEMVTSIFRPDEPCKLAEKQSPAKNCCKGSTCGKPTDEQEHNCADCTSQFVKLDVKYLLPTFFDLKPFVFVAPQPVHFDNDVHFAVGEKMLLRWQQDLPPPPGGRELLPWIQSFLC